MTAFRLGHLSDPHLAPPPLPFRWRDVASKRLLSRFAWRRKHERHAKAVLDLICSDVRARAPDHLAITGDLINFATPEEFEAARVWLETFGDPANLTVSPGNHDALAAAGAPTGFGPWKPWLGDADGDFPHLRLRGPVAIVNLSSAVPTALHLARGLLGAEQLNRLRSVLTETGARGLYRVVLVHHPVVRGVVSSRKGLVDAEALRDTLREVGAELVLHGHAHEALLTRTPGPTGPIPIMGVPSASTPPRGEDPPARWNEIEILREGNAFRSTVHARGVTEGQPVQPLGSFVLG